LGWLVSVEAGAQVAIRPGSDLNILAPDKLPSGARFFDYSEGQVVPLSRESREVPVSSVPRMETPDPLSGSILADTLSIRLPLLSLSANDPSQIEFKDGEPLYICDDRR
jgi:hypothetical protein